MIKLGDVFELRLSNGRKAYGQFVHKDKVMGPLLQVFSLVTEKDATLDEIMRSGPLFPPVITGLYAAVRKGLWKVVGHLPVENFIYPNFIRTLYDQETGKASIWFLWNGEKSIRIGSELTPEQKKLEYLAVWSPYDVVLRIEAGELPFPYGELIRDNKFKPKKK